MALGDSSTKPIFELGYDASRTSAVPCRSDSLSTPDPVIDVLQRDVPQSRDADCANQNLRKSFVKEFFCGNLTQLGKSSIRNYPATIVVADSSGSDRLLRSMTKRSPRKTDRRRAAGGHRINCDQLAPRHGNNKVLLRRGCGWLACVKASVISILEKAYARELLRFSYTLQAHIIAKIRAQAA
jgi:hypothetical protein